MLDLSVQLQGILPGARLDALGVGATENTNMPCWRNFASTNLNVNLLDAQVPTAFHRKCFCRLPDPVHKVACRVRYLEVALANQVLLVAA